MQSKVVMFSSKLCPFCYRASALLKKKNANVEELIVDGRPELRQEMMKKSGRHTVPQIWIGETHVGGCDDLFMMERSGELDKLLS